MYYYKYSIRDIQVHSNTHAVVSLYQGQMLQKNWKKTEKKIYTCCCRKPGKVLW